MKLSTLSTKLSTFFFFIGVFVFATTASAPRVFASTVFTDNFDSYSTGTIVGQGGWSGYGTVINTDSVSPSKSMQVSGAGGVPQSPSMTTVSLGYFEMNYKWVTGGSGTKLPFYLNGDGGSATKITTNFQEGGGSTHSAFGITGISNDVWHTVVVEFDCATDEYRVSLDSGTFTSWIGMYNTCNNISNFSINGYWDGNQKIDDVTFHDSAWTPPITDFSTRFIEITPLDGDTVSSTTPVTVGSHLYINASDYDADQYLSITFQNDTVSNIGGSVLDAWNSAWGTGSTGGFAEIRLAVTSGDNDISTTTSNFIRDGRVTATYALKSPTFWSSLWVVGGLFSGSTVMSTTTQFIVGEKTSFDEAIDAGDNGLANGILFGTTTDIIGSNFNADVCTVSNFNLIGCLKGIIVPSPQAFQTLFTQAKDGFLSYFPFGYVTRFYAIVSGTATSTLPVLSMTIPTGFPSGGNTITLSPWGHLMGQGSYLATATSTQTGVTFYSSFEVYWNRFVYFVFGLGVCLRLLGMNDTVTLPFGRSRQEKEYAERQKLRDASNKKRK